MPWAAAGAIGGALIASNASGKAAKGQEQATAQANALQRYMFDQNQALQMPTITAGNTARDRLQYLLGLSPTGSSGGGSTAPTLTYDQLRAQLLGQYTRTGTPGQSVANPSGDPATAYNLLSAAMNDPNQAMRISGAGNETRPGYGPGYWMPGATGMTDEANRWVSTADQQQSYVDESALDAEIRKRLADQDAQRQAAIAAAQNDPNFGRLAQQFEFEKYTPETFSYTGEDLYNDPSYKFRLDQGQKALDRQGAAAGRFLSGRQLQASSDYNQGAASQEFQNAYTRALGTFGTNEGNRFNAFATNEGNRFNAYQANFNNAVNPLLSLAGAATLGSQNLGAAGAGYASQVGNNLTGQANASGAAGIAGANQISNGLTNAYNGYQQQQQNTQQNNMLQQLINRSGSINNNPSGFSFDSMGASSGNSLLGATSNPWA